MRNIVLIILVSVFCQVCCGEVELKGNPAELTAHLKTDREVVVLRGRATLEPQSNEGAVTISVTTEDGSLEQALRENQRIREEITGKLTKLGIAGDCIKISKFSSTPKYSIWTDKAKSYSVDNIVKISIKSEEDFQRVGKIVDGYKEVRYQV